jgi:hypothetical protein
MSENLPAESKTFEQKMKDRIKDSIGDLLSDEDIKKLVDKGMQDVFFTRSRIKDPRDYYKTIDGPTLLEEILKECVQPTVNKVVKEYVDEHPEEVMIAVKEVISMGMSGAMIRSMDMIFNSQIMQLQTNIQNQMSQIRRPI